MQGVLLDTSFLITLADRNRANHETARKYWKFFLESNTPIYLSTIVISEFELKQPIDNVILKSCIVLPFNHADAIKSAQLNFANTSPRRRGGIPSKMISRSSPRPMFKEPRSSSRTTPRRCSRFVAS